MQRSGEVTDSSEYIMEVGERGDACCPWKYFAKKVREYIPCACPARTVCCEVRWGKGAGAAVPCDCSSRAGSACDIAEYDGFADVIVVGGGPAGATAAFVLARAGVDVLLLESASYPRDKLCGGLLSRKTISALFRIYGLSDMDLIARGLIDYSSDQYDILCDGVSFEQGRCAYPFHFTRRAVFDHWLIQQAQAHGAVVRENSAVASCTLGGDSPHNTDSSRVSFCRLSLASPVTSSIGLSDACSGKFPETPSNYASVLLESGKRFACRYLIGADGVHSIVRRQFDDVDKKQWHRALATTIEARIPRELFPCDVIRPSVHLGQIGEGYGWVFPNSDTVVVGLGGRLERGENLAVMFKEFACGLGLNGSKLQLSGHPLPYDNMLESLHSGRALLAGDAGGLVEPVFGEGIFNAIRSGEAAAHAILDCGTDVQKVGPRYMQSIQVEIIQEIAYSRRLQKLLFLFDRKGRSAMLKLGVKLGSRLLLDVIHGQRSYRFFCKVEEHGTSVAL